MYLLERNIPLAVPCGRLSSKGVGMSLSASMFSVSNNVHGIFIFVFLYTFSAEFLTFILLLFKSIVEKLILSSLHRCSEYFTSIVQDTKVLFKKKIPSIIDVISYNQSKLSRTFLLKLIITCYFNSCHSVVSEIF